jgi:hypothetical protein
MAGKLPQINVPSEQEDYAGAETENPAVAVQPPAVAAQPPLAASAKTPEQADNDVLESPAARSLANSGTSGPMKLSIYGDVNRAIYMNHLQEIRMFHPKAGENGKFAWVNKENLKTSIEEGFLPVSYAGRLKEIDSVNPPLETTDGKLVFSNDEDGSLKYINNEDRMKAYDSGYRPVSLDEFAERKRANESLSSGTIPSAMAAGFVSESTMGISDFIIPEETTEIMKKNYPVSYLSGQILSYLVPIGPAALTGKAVASGVGKVIGKPLGKVATMAARGIGEGAFSGATRLVTDYAETDHVPDIKRAASQIALSSAVGGVFSAALGGVIKFPGAVKSYAGKKLIEKIPQDALENITKLETMNDIIKNDLKSLDNIISDNPRINNLIKDIQGLRLNNIARETAGALDDTHMQQLNDLESMLSKELDKAGWKPQYELPNKITEEAIDNIKNTSTRYFDLIEAGKKYSRLLKDSYAKSYKDIGNSISVFGAIGSVGLAVGALDSGLLAGMGVGVGTYWALKPIVASIFRNSIPKVMKSGVNDLAFFGGLEAPSSKIASGLKETGRRFGNIITIESIDKISNNMKVYKEFEPITILNEEQFKYEKERMSKVDPQKVFEISKTGYITSELDADSSEALSRFEGVKAAWLKQAATKDRISYSKALAAIDFRGVIYRLGNDSWTKEDLEFSQMAAPQLWNNLMFAASDLEKDIYNLEPKDRKLVSALIKQNNRLRSGNPSSNLQNIIQTNYTTNPQGKGMTQTGGQMPTEAAATNLTGGK